MTFSRSVDLEGGNRRRTRRTSLGGELVTSSSLPDVGSCRLIAWARRHRSTMPDAPNHIWNFFSPARRFFFFFFLNDAIIVKKKKVSKKFRCTKKRSLKSFNEIRLLDVLEHSTGPV